MKKKNGFTLVELLAVIVLLGLLAAVAIPNALNLSSKVKGKAYETKIELIEQAANNFGQTNLASVRRGRSIKNPNLYYTCKFSIENDEITSVQYNSYGASYDESLTLQNNQYWCIKVTVEDLVDANDLEWDNKDACDDRCTTDALKSAYTNTIINPKTNGVINKCNIYIYYKNNRVYSYFDKKTCDQAKTSPQEGFEYRAL